MTVYPISKTSLRQGSQPCFSLPAQKSGGDDSAQPFYIYRHLNAYLRRCQNAPPGTPLAPNEMQAIETYLDYLFSGAEFIGADKFEDERRDKRNEAGGMMVGTHVERLGLFSCADRDNDKNRLSRSEMRAYLINGIPETMYRGSYDPGGTLPSAEVDERKPPQANRSIFGGGPKPAQ